MRNIFPKKDKPKEEKEKPLKKERSVIFMDRTKKISKTTFPRRRKVFGIRTAGVFSLTRMKRIVTVIFLLCVTAGISIFVLRFHTESSAYISPIAGNIAAASSDEVGGKIVTELHKNNIEYTKIDTTDVNQYKIMLKDNGVVFLTGDKEIAQQIASLQFILNRLTMEGKSVFKSLDLRFDKPVVVFK